MGEVENISPGLQRKLIVQLAQPGTYQTACKPGMIGDGIRGDFTVTGEAVQVDTEGKFKEAADSYKRYVNSQVEALVRRWRRSSPPSRRAISTAAKAQFPTSRTYFERIEPVAESFPERPRPAHRPARGRPGARPEVDRLPRAGEAAVGDRSAARHQRDRRPAGCRRQGTPRRCEIPRLQHRLHPDRRWRPGIARRDRRQQDHRRRGHLQPHRPVGLQGQRQGSQTAVASVRPILDERNPDLGKSVDQRFAEVEALLEKYRQGDGFVLVRQGDRAAAPGTVACHRRAVARKSARCKVSSLPQ